MNECIWTDVGSTKVWGGGPISHFSKHLSFVNYAANYFILFLLPTAVEHQSSIFREKVSCFLVV